MVDADNEKVTEASPHFHSCNNAQTKASNSAVQIHSCKDTYTLLRTAS